MKSPKQTINNVSILLLIIIGFSCNEEPPIIPPPPNGEDSVKNTINIELIWKELKAISLKISPSAQDTGIAYNYTLKRYDEIGNEKLIFQSSLNGDTTIIDNNEGMGLNPGEQYRYKVEGINTEGELKDTSKTLTIITLAPTSHNFTWQVDTLGQPGNFLKDVWGLDEDNIWAVGAVNMPEGVTSVIKWDGTEWNYHSWPEGRANGVFGFSNDKIFIAGSFGSYGFLGTWDGNKWDEINFLYVFPNGDTVWALQSIWGSRPDDVWAVGFSGTIIHWDGSEWTKVPGIESKYNFWDVWGVDENTVYAVGNKSSDEMAIYRYDGEGWQKIFTDNINGSRTSSVWGANPEDVFVTDYYNYRILNGQVIQSLILIQKSVIERIRGSGANNIFTAGHFGDVMHYNGEEWASQEELYTHPESRLLEGVWVFDEKVFIVGQSANSGAIVIQGEKP